MRRACRWVALPAVACALLLACDGAGAAETLADGICPSMDIRNDPKSMLKLRGCQVIEGHLSIVLMERGTPAAFENVTFPELREVTGYILIYRLKGVRNLGDLFPNLSVIRGLQLFKDFALVIFDNELESLGLRSLSKIQAGAVRIQNNDRLCYVNTIDWSRINGEDAKNNILRSNYDIRLCGLCRDAQSRMKDRPSKDHPTQCPDYKGRLLCWDDKHCQKVCPAECGDRACMDDKTCCHHNCLGGCDGPTSSDCHVCANFSLDDGKRRTCVEKCPDNTYELSKRCVTEEACRNTKPPQNDFSDAAQRAPHIRAYKLLNNTCVYVCPSGYREVGNYLNSTCERCPPKGCNQECMGGKIDSKASAELFQGCTHVKGSLEISLRTGSGNIMSTLEKALGEVRVIDGSLRVGHSYPLVSLMFLRSLRRIGGRTNDAKAQSLYIFNNPNLEMLWNWTNHGNIVIETGKLFIHFNPKLCNNKIEPLKNMTRDPISTFSDLEVTNNGDQASCFEDTLHLKVFKLFQEVAILTWDMYCIAEDMRKLLGYSIYYVAAEHDVTLYDQRDACSDTWNVLDVTTAEVRNHTTPTTSKNKTMLLQNPCQDVQPLFYHVTQLTPFTRYAAYVKTYTTQQQRGAQSPIIYFKTLPGSPSPPLDLTVEAQMDSAVIKWQPPSMSNGTIAVYRVEIQANNYNRPMILALNVDSCSNPSALVNLIAVRAEDSGSGFEKKESGVTGKVEGEACVCRDETRHVRFSSVAEDERVESIDFENAVQNLVYVRKNESAKNRVRRSVDNSVNSMLVILNSTHVPSFGSNYTNTTEGKHVKSLYYDLDGNARSLTVGNLRHFTWYTVNVWACREKHENETEEQYTATFCSEGAHYTFRTLKRSNADVVRNLHVEVLNKTLPEVNVTWQPPEDPNGFVVAYKVHHSRVEDGNQEVASCIPAADYEASGRRMLVRNLAPGNYSVRVTPLTLSGPGHVSPDRYVFIPERTAALSYEWVWGVVGGCAALLALAAAGVWYARRALLPLAETNKLFATVNPEYVSTVYVPDDWEVPRASIEFIRELGQGSFGMVYEGIAKNIEKGKPETRCAVKTVNEHATDRERIEFLNEASVMKAFDTFHVVRLLGVVSQGQPTLVVMELMEQGDLKTYLRSHRPDAESSLPKKGTANAPPTLQNILQMAIEIADGMAYLSAKKFVHRDLAARNCMVAGDLTVKVGDFGMTRDIYETDYYRKGTKGLLPVRWMSPESLKDGVFSSSSDAWSYGVVLWEMATLAMQPYQGLSNEQVVRYVVEGGVMERPEHCPDRLYELMRACWAHRAPQRPSFLQLVADLAPAAQPYFRHRSFFHTPQGQEMYALQRTAMVEEESDPAEVNVGAMATGSGSNLFGVSGRLATWVRELSLRSRGSDDAAAEPLAPHEPRAFPLKARAPPPNGVLHSAR